MKSAEKETKNTEISVNAENVHACNYSGWLITKKANIQSSVWATVTKLGMWVVVGISKAHVCLSLPNEHIQYLICISVIKGKSPEHFLIFPQRRPTLYIL